jgi:hypothetical protein
MRFDPSDLSEPDHAASHTDQIIGNLELYGYSPGPDEPDPRPLPAEDDISGAVTEIFGALIGVLGDTCLEPELEDVLWSVVNVFHRSADRLQRQLDRNVDAQRGSQGEQDGSEVKSVILERLIEDGKLLTDKRNSFEDFRDSAADLFEIKLGSAWRPRAGSQVNHKAMTAAVIDSKDFIAAKRRADLMPLLPAGTRIAFAGGLDYNDHAKIWDALDKVHAKHPEMVLLHGASPRGAELIAAKWAESRKVVQIGFKPDWTRHAKAAPFKRNDLLLETLPVGLIVFPGSGITDNLADKAKRLGIPVWRFEEGRA